MVLVWYIGKEPEDQNQLLKQLAKLGIFYKKLYPENFENGEQYFEDPLLKKIVEEHGYISHDIMVVHPDKLQNYEMKLKDFFKEHKHDDDEVRYIIDGEGYFDVRDENDSWLRIMVEKGDLICLPAGIYHRFTVTNKNYVKAIRLYVDNSGWTPIYRTG